MNYLELLRLGKLYNLRIISVMKNIYLWSYGHETNETQFVFL